MEKYEKTSGVLSLVNHPALDTVGDYAEIGLDSLMSDSLLGQLPLIGTLVAFARAGVTMSDGILIRKICRFREGIKDIPGKERERFLERLEREGSGGEISEKLLMIIDRQDDILKLDIIAEIFRAHVRGEIEQSDQDMLFYCVGQAHAVYVQSISRYEKGFESGDVAAGKALYLAGLAEWDIVTGELVLDGDSLGSSIHYKLNRYGTLLAGILIAREKRLSESE